MLAKLVRKLHQRGALSNLLEVLRRLGLLAVAFRVYQWLSALNFSSKQDRQVRAASAERPIPPSDLLVLVQGTPDVEWYLVSGKSMFQAIVDVLHKHNAPVENMQAILEFGCGCGRVLGCWGDVHGPVVHGTDYNSRLIKWCSQHLPFAKTGINDLHPPLSYKNGTFDFIYAISVFTHLSERLQIQWMQEFSRILKPNGWLLFTTHGESFRDKLNETELAAFDSGRLVVRYDEISGTNLCNAYHPGQYVRHRLATGYSVRDFIPAGTLPTVYQDIYLIRKTTG